MKWLALLALFGALPAQAQIRPDSSAFIILAANHGSRTFDLYVKAADDTSYSRVGSAVPQANVIFVLPSPQLGQSPICVILWLLVGSHEMAIDTITRQPGVVNIYRREFGEPHPIPQRS